jgi:hypothetical protein
VKGIKLKAFRMGRKTALLGASVAVVGLSLIAGGVAHAGVGSNPGQLTLNPGTGALTSSPTWSTSAACPAGFSFGTLQEEFSDSTPANPDYNTIGAQTLGATAPITNAALVAGDSIGTLESQGGWSTGGVAEFVVLCSTQAGGLGQTTFDQATFVTFGATTYSTSATGPAQAATPVVTLSATPNPAQAGSTVTITATVTSSGNAVSAGSVQFLQGTGDIGTPVTLSAAGVAQTTTTFTTTGSPFSLTADFITGNAAAFNDATSNTVSETVTANNPLAQSEVIQVTVAPTGSFSWSVPTPEPVVTLALSGSTATGALVPGTLIDTRTGIAANQFTAANLVNGFSGFPGWSVVGQAVAFTNPLSQPAGTIAASNLNWTPTTPTQGDFVLGGASTTGLGTAQTLATAATGHGDGTFTLGANLSLAVPTNAPAGLYQSTLTMTADPVANFGL